MSKTDEITIKAQPQGFHLDDKTIKQVERMIKKMSPADDLSISTIYARQPFTQVPEGSRCMVCGYVNPAEIETCVICETTGQVVITVKRGESV